MTLFEEILNFINDTYEEIEWWWEDFYSEYIEENEFVTDLTDECSYGIVACAEYLYELPAEQIALMILAIFAVIFVIMRIFFWIFKDTEIW